MMFRAIIPTIGLLTLPAILPQPAAASGPPASRCARSTQQHWSEVRRACVNLDRQAIKLASKIGGGRPAFVLFHDGEDTGPAELFLPGDPHGMLLRKVKDDGAGTWRAGQYTLTQWRGMFSLDNSRGHTIYQGAEAP